MVKIHFDTDIGGDMDDLRALAMLLKWPDLDITGITTVAEAYGRRAGYEIRAEREKLRRNLFRVAQRYHQFSTRSFGLRYCFRLT